MAEKKITRRVISKASTKVSKEPVETDESVQKTDSSRVTSEAGRVKKACFFCQSKTSPSYTDVVVLRRFLSDRAKIVPALRNGLCSKHQRAATRQIKYARQLALLPFTPKV